MIQLNLLPDVKREFLATRRTRAKVISGSILATLVFIGLTVVAALWVYLGQTLQKTILDSSIKKNISSLQGITDIDKYLTVQNQLANLSALHDSKNDFSRLIDYLPALNPAPPKNIKLTNVDLQAADKTLVLQGETANYTALDTFKDTLGNAQFKYTDDSGAQQSVKLFTAVNVDSSSLQKADSGASVVGFKITTTYNEIVFLNSTKSPSVSVPNIDTTQSAQSAPNVFGKSSVQTGGAQ